MLWVIIVSFTHILCYSLIAGKINKHRIIIAKSVLFRLRLNLPYL